MTKADAAKQMADLDNLRALADLRALNARIAEISASQEREARARNWDAQNPIWRWLAQNPYRNNQR